MSSATRSALVTGGRELSRPGVVIQTVAGDMSKEGRHGYERLDPGSGAR
jgi:hypothetical protein